MKLYYSPGACSLADHIALEWIGQPYEATPVSREALKSPEYLAINPAGAVPALDDGGWVLTQNAAILNYLADLAPGSGLGGDGTPRSRARINQWLGMLNADIHPAFLPFFGATAYLEDAALIERSKQAAGAKLRGLFERVDRQLQGRDWLTGERSIADPYLFVVTRWARSLHIDLSGLPDLERFFQSMSSEPGVRAALAQEGLA
jgi:glutathione S-transferase